MDNLGRYILKFKTYFLKRFTILVLLQHQLYFPHQRAYLGCISAKQRRKVFNRI